MTIFDVLFAINAPEANLDRAQYRAMVKFLHERIAHVNNADFEQRADLFYYLIMLHLKYESSNGEKLAAWYQHFQDALLAQENVLKDRLKKAHKEAHHRAYVQLNYFYKLTLYYLEQLVAQFAVKNFADLSKTATAERLFFESHKKFLQGKYVDFFDVKRKEYSYRFRKHYALFVLVGSIGFIMFWHGLSGVLEMIPFIQIPVVSLVVGLVILVFSGFFYTFTEHDGDRHSREP